MNDSIIRVLSIEDNPTEAALIQDKLDQAQCVGWNLPHFEVEHVSRLETALARLDGEAFDVVLTDLDLPDSRAGQTVATLRERIPHMPLVVLTGRDDEILAQKSVRAGVQDYLYKSEATGSLLARTMMYAIERQQIHAQLEQRVEERTRELKRANEELKTEITERRRAEKALRESERKYRGLVEQSLQGLVIAQDDPVRIPFASQPMETITGFSPEELMALGPQELASLIHPQDRPTFFQSFRDRLQGKAVPPRSEYRIIHKEGEVRWVELYSSRIGYEGQPATQTLFLDITERKRVEEALRASERKLELMLDTMVDGMVMVNLEGEIIYANQAAEEILEVRKDGILGRYYSERTWRQIDEENQPYPPDQLPLAIALREQRAVRDVEHGIIAPDGEIKWLSVNAAPFVEEEGQLRGAVASFRDTTEHRRAEDAIRWRSEANQAIAHLSAALLEQTPVAGIAYQVLEHARRLTGSAFGYVGYIDPQTGHLVCPTMTRDIWDDCQVPGKDIVFEQFGGLWGWVLENQEPLLTNAPQDDPRSSGTPEGHLPIRRFLSVPALIGGELVGQIALANPADDYGEQDLELVERMASIYALALQRQRSEERIERYAANLERSNRDLEQLGYAISHDLQEPLRVISSYLQLLAQRYGGQLDVRADKYIDYAVDGAERMQKMTRALLDLSRVGNRGHPFEPTDAGDVLKQTLRDLKQVIRESGAQVTHDPLPTVTADRIQLGQVFQNLIANGIKFRREDQAVQIHVSATQEDGEWIFSIADDGIGIDPQHAERIFQVFQRLHTESEYPGLGMGLAVCRRIVERHGGRIWVTSEPGRGATFYFTLPA